MKHKDLLLEILVGRNNHQHQN